MAGSPMSSLTKLRAKLRRRKAKTRKPRMVMDNAGVRRVQILKKS